MKKSYLLLLFVLLSMPAFCQNLGDGSGKTAENNCFAVGVGGHEMALLTDIPADFLSLCGDTAASFSLRPRRTHWRFGVDVTTFFRDAEFFLPYTKGYTATGFFVSPYGRRMIGRHALVTLGVHLAGVAGHDGFRQWQPLVRLEYEPHPNWRLVMGSIYGTLSHGLFEPMLDRERYVYDHQEEGVQILGRLPFGPCLWRTDTWIHWEELLEPWQPTQERFTLGSNNSLKLFSLAYDDGAAGFSVAVPFSFLGSHRGGQFTALDTCIQTLFNENVGLRLSCQSKRAGAFDLDFPLFFYQDMSPTKCMAYDNGWGLWPQASWNYELPRKVGTPWRGQWQLQLQAGYWHGHQFIAPRGSYLFQSVSWHDPAFATPEREMVTAKMALANAYERLTLGLDAEFYYDLREQGLDMAFGLYMRYRL